MKLVYQEKELKEGLINLPASKSISNRALIICALGKFNGPLENLSDATDTQLMQSALRNKSTKKNVGIAGTVARFLTAYLATHKSPYIITGDKRIYERPMHILLEALESLGAEITYLQTIGHLPIQISGKGIQGGEVAIESSVSSQFITALMLIGPNLEGGLKINLKGKPSSKPYIHMTAKMMQHFGIKGLEISDSEIFIPEQIYQEKSLTIESDWSAASYFYSIIALLDEGSVILKNLHFDTWQGDSEVADIYYRLGVTTSKSGENILLEKSTNIIDYLEYNFVDCPDLAQSVICTCIGLGIEGLFTGLHTLKNKETDRVLALQNEVKKINWLLEEIEPGSYALKRNTSLHVGEIIIKTYNDHRMAMAFAPLAIIHGDITIEKATVVKKSFPYFWVELKKIGIQTCQSTN